MCGPAGFLCLEALAVVLEAFCLKLFLTPRFVDNGGKLPAGGAPKRLGSVALFHHVGVIPHPTTIST